MSRSIDSVTIGGTPDGRMVFANAHAARYIAIGTNWTKIRMIARFAMDDDGGNLIGTPRFGFGVIASPTANLSNGVLTATCSHFCGLSSNTGTWTRGTSPIVNYSTGGMFSAKRVLNTWTNGSGATTLISAAPSSIRVALVLQITKGSPNFTFDMVMVQGTGGLLDVPKSSLKGALEVALPSDIVTFLNSAIGGSGTRYGTTSNVLAVSETSDGFFNAITMFWARTTPVMGFSDIMFAKIA